MTQTLKDPFKGLVLDEEEQAIEDSSEEYVSAPDLAEARKLVKDAARQYVHLNTSKPITLRVKQTDLIKIKAKAKRNNIPYQTLLGVVLHDFAENKSDLVIK